VLTESTGDLTNLTGGVIVDELDNCKVKYAKCCNPLPGDSIIGFITRGHGISIHKYTCSNVVAGLANLETRDRFLSASWTKKSLEAVVASFESQINIVSFNTVHLLADISNALADMHVGVLSISSRMIDEDHILLIMTVKTRNTEHLNSIVSKLKRLPDITRVYESHHSNCHLLFIGGGACS
jgi:GTP pyrophosphokinase